MLPVKSVLEDLVIWVKFVKNGVSILLLACREDNDFELFSHFLKESKGIRANVDSELMSLGIVVV